MLNSGKKDTSQSEVETFQQVIVELRAEVKSLSEELEQEKKAANDANSLKTKQISTLTSKLADAVRQRERAEEELAEVNKEMEELKEELRLLAEEREAKEREDDTTQDGLKDNGISSLQLENKCDPLPIENSPTDELSQSAAHTELSLSLSSALSDDSFKDKNEDLFLLEVSQISSSEIYDSNYINHSFDSKEENPEEKEATTEEFVQIKKDLCEGQENMRKKILEAANPPSSRKNIRICAEDQELSQPSSPEAVSSGYTSNSTDEKLVNLLMCHEVGDYRTAVFSGNEDKAHPKCLLNEYESDDVTGETSTAQDKKLLEDLITRERKTAKLVLNTNYKALEERCLSSETTGTVHEAEKGDRQSSELQNDFLPHIMSEEFWDLKQQLKNALKEIEDLRLENKEMKREIRNLSTSAAEEEFLLKATKFTDRLLKEMKDREARMYVPRGASYLEKYGLDRDYSYPGSTDLSQMRSTGDMNRSEGKKTSLPLKIIGAKLKELTRSVENMAIDPELRQENNSEVCVPDFMSYKQRYPSLNGQIGLEESMIMPVPCSETISQSTAFPQENPRERLQGGSYTSLEKLEEKRFLGSSKLQPQFSEEACVWKENKFQLDTDRETEERSDYDSPRDKWRLHSDTRDYVQRYVVRSSDHIAKMRDLTPEEKALYSN